jgi:hypothetical protein
VVATEVPLGPDKVVVKVAVVVVKPLDSSLCPVTVKSEQSLVPSHPSGRHHGPFISGLPGPSHGQSAHAGGGVCVAAAEVQLEYTEHCEDMPDVMDAKSGGIVEQEAERQDASRLLAVGVAQ